MAVTLTLSIEDETLQRLRRVADERRTTIETVAEDALLAFAECPVPPDDDEHALEQIRAGLAEADRGEFVAAEEVEAFFAKYRR